MKIKDTLTLNRNRQTDFVKVTYKPSSDPDWRAPWIERHALKERKWREDATIEIEINTEAIFRQLGGKAVGNKTGKSSAMHGLIKARVTNRVEHNVQLTEIPIPDGYEIVSKFLPNP